MRWRPATLFAAAIALAGCEHPIANGAQQAPAPVAAVPAAFRAAPVSEAEQAVVASATLQALLRRFDAAPLSASAFPASAASADALRPFVAGSWLEAQSANLRALVDRSRRAQLAVDAARGQQ